MARTMSRTIDLEPIDRLEEKVKLLVAMIERMKVEQTRAADENVRLAQELELARARAADADASTAEMAALREERETIRTRVADMLEQLESLSL